MTYKLFLDDVRHPKFLAERGIPSPLGQWVIARSYDEGINVVEAMGVPDFIAFDHDLEDAHYDGKEGHEKTGLSFAEWLTNYIDDNNIELSEQFDWVVHSMNPSGAARISAHMSRWFLRKLKK